MLPLLIGSRAMNLHFGVSSSNADWDFISLKIIKKSKCDYLDINEETNLILLNHCNQLEDNVIVDTPVGKAILCPIPLLKVIYRSSLPMKSLKFEEHLMKLNEVVLNSFQKNILERRLIETKKRIEESSFFGDSVPRLFSHDLLHILILPKENKPSFLKILDFDSLVIGNKMAFINLSNCDKLKLIFEEVFVFSLERNLIPSIIENPARIELFLSVEFNPSNDSSVMYYWINKFAVNNGVNRFPKYISKYIRDNKNELISYCKENWESHLDNLPESFWKKLIVSN